MKKIYKIAKDPYVFNDQYYKIAGLILFFVGIYYSLNSSPLWAIVLLVGLILIILGFVKSSGARNSFKVEIADSNLTLGNNTQGFSQILISQINAIAQNYEVRKINSNTRAPLITPAHYIFTAFQWGYSIKTQDGKVSIIPKNINDFGQFLKDLQNVNPSIQEDQVWEAANKSQADAEVQKNSLQEKQWHEENKGKFFQKY